MYVGYLIIISVVFRWLRNGISGKTYFSHGLGAGSHMVGRVFSFLCCHQHELTLLTTLPC